MGTFGKSFTREMGKNTGKVASNILFGDWHSTPYRRVDKARMAAVEARTERDRRRDVFAIDNAVLQNIDAVAAYRFSTEKEELLRQLSEMEIQLKVNKWHNVSDGDDKVTAEAKVRNKFCDALFEKYKQGVRTLKTIDADEPQLEHFEKIQKKTARSKFIRKYPLYIGVATFFLIAPIALWLSSLDKDELAMVITLFTVVAVITISLTIFFKVRKKRRKNAKFQQSIQAQIQQQQQYQQPVQNQNIEQNYIPQSSIFIDLNENNRIENRLSSIWSRYRNSVDKQIINRKPIFSADGVKDSILFVGVNPSYNPNDDRIFVHSSDDKSLMYGSLYQIPDAPDYFKELENFAEKAGFPYSHINLLYARENNRDLLLQQDHNFIREQLELTYDTILNINPKAIIFFTDYCRDLIFAHWVNPATEKSGSYILNGTNIPAFFTDDITIMDDTAQITLIQQIKFILNRR